MSSLLSSCLGDSNGSEVVVTNYSNATVKTFSFSNNDSVCAGLSGYAFTIDHLGTSDPELAARWPGAGIIFNSDSLPVGSVPDTITVSMTYSSPSAVKFYHYDASANLVDSVDFSESQKVNFSPYATTLLRLTANDRLTTKDYIVKVNVHTVIGDTIRWGLLSEDLLPGLSDVVTFRADTLDGLFCVLAAASDSSVWMSECDFRDLVRGWSEPVCTGTMQELNPATLWSSGNRFFCVGLDGKLRYSYNGRDWILAANPDGLTFCNLLGLQLKANGAASDTIRAIVLVDGTCRFAAAADPDEVWTVGDVLPEGFPVTGYTRPVSTPAAPQRGNRTSRIYITGGLTPDDVVISSSWCCDGIQWAEFVQTALPPVMDASVTPYCTDTDEPGTLWILAPGYGMNGTLFFSENKGVAWKKLSREYPSYADTENLGLEVCPSMYLDSDSWRLYVFELHTGRIRLVTGQLTQLTFLHRR